MADVDRKIVTDWESALGFSSVDDGVQVVPGSLFEDVVAAEPFEGGLFPYTPLRPMLIVLEPATIPGASGPAGHLEAVAGILARTIGDGAEVRVSTVAGVELRLVRDLGQSTGIRAIYVPVVDPISEPERAGGDPRAMQRITARLRQPDGCPWDRKQTHQSLRTSMIDEVYEVTDAIDSGDPAHLAEELGDLFLLIMMQAQIAREAGEFSIEDVYRGIATKIVGRHPHVFGDAVVTSDADLSGVWAAAKAKEKADGGDRGGKDMDGEPFSMPALERAARILKRYPVAPGEDAPALLRLVSELVARGEDPEALLRQQVRDHVARQS